MLDNPNGSAPGLLFQLAGDRLLVLLPGPPREMRPMFEDQVCCAWHTCQRDAGCAGGW